MPTLTLNSYFQLIIPKIFIIRSYNFSVIHENASSESYSLNQIKCGKYKITKKNVYFESPYFKLEALKKLMKNVSSNRHIFIFNCFQKSLKMSMDLDYLSVFPFDF